MFCFICYCRRWPLHPHLRPTWKHLSRSHLSWGTVTVATTAAPDCILWHLFQGFDTVTNCEICFKLLDFNLKKPQWLISFSCSLWLLSGCISSVWHDRVLWVRHTSQHLLQQAHWYAGMAGRSSHDEKGERSSLPTVSSTEKKDRMEIGKDLIDLWINETPIQGTTC